MLCTATDAEANDGSIMYLHIVNFGRPPNSIGGHLEKTFGGGHYESI